MARWIAAVTCVLSIALYALSSWPSSCQRGTIDIPAADFTPGGSAGQPEPNAPAAARLTLDWPARAEVGEPQTIRLVAAPAVSSPGFPSIPAITGNGHLVAESRLDLGGAATQPEGAIQQPWPPGQSLTFTWTLTLNAPGTYDGSAWFYLVFVNPNGTVESKTPISDQNVEIQAWQIFGIRPQIARIGSLVCLAAGCLLTGVSLIKRRQIGENPPKV